jgi:hypothetical protein
MELMFLFLLGAGLAIWLGYRRKTLNSSVHTAGADQDGSRAGLSQQAECATETTVWRDPLADINEDAVVYNGYKTVPLRVHLQYTDGYGESTEREVDIQSYDDTTEIGMFSGHCHLRGKVRSFYFARVKRAIDVKTGEVIEDLRGHLNGLWGNSTGPAWRVLSGERALELEILLYVAKCDKALRAAELEIIAKYCQEITGEDRLTPTAVRNFLDYTRLPTTLQSFKIKFGTLQQHRPESALRVAGLCHAIVATQKTVHPDERAALEYLDLKIVRAVSK